MNKMYRDLLKVKEEFCFVLPFQQYWQALIEFHFSGVMKVVLVAHHCYCLHLIKGDSYNPQVGHKNLLLMVGYWYSKP